MARAYPAHEQIFVWHNCNIAFFQVLAPFFYSTVVSLLKRTFKRPTEALPARMRDHPLLYNIVREGVVSGSRI